MKWSQNSPAFRPCDCVLASNAAKIFRFYIRNRCVLRHETRPFLKLRRELVKGIWFTISADLFVKFIGEWYHPNSLNKRDNTCALKRSRVQLKHLRLSNQRLKFVAHADGLLSHMFLTRREQPAPGCAAFLHHVGEVIFPDDHVLLVVLDDCTLQAGR